MPLLRRFRLSLRGELALLVAVLLVTGLLASSLPARDVIERQSSEFAATMLLPEASITLRLDPGRVGTNDLSVTLGPVDVEQFGRATQVTAVLSAVRLSGDANQPATSTIVLQQSSPADPFTFRAASPALHSVGEWQVQVTVERADLPPLATAFALDVRRDGIQPAGYWQAEAGSSPVPGPLVLAWFVVAALAAASAAWLYRRQQRVAYGLFATALLAVVMGSALALAGQLGQL